MPPLTAPNFLAFLRASKAALHSPTASFPSLHLVLGNEACDADSVVSALLYAFHLHAHAPPPSPRLLLPLVSCRRADWPLRREAASLLALALPAPAPGAPPATGAGTAELLAEALVFLDDGPLAAHAARLRAGAGNDGEALTATLMDHNKLDSGGEGVGLRERSVVAIVDHHADAGAHAHVAGAARQVSFDTAEGRGVGSTCTLVAAAALAATEGASGPPFDAPLAQMLLGVILLDTVGLAEAAGKTTAEDRRVAGALEPLCGGAPFDPAAFHSQLAGLRNDPAFWAGLTVPQALSYDFKSFAPPGAHALRIGASAMTVPLASLLCRGEGGGIGREMDAGILSACAQWGVDKGVAFLVLLSAAPPPPGAVPGSVRQLAFFEPAEGCAHAPVARAVLGKLRGCAALALREAGRGGTADGGVAWLFEQGNATASRKQILPLLLQWAAEGAYHTPT